MPGRTSRWHAGVAPAGPLWPYFPCCPHDADSLHLSTRPYRPLATSRIFASSVGSGEPDSYVGQNWLHVVRSIREQRRSVTVLLAGTSGTGKSTLAGLLAARLGISTVLSTDSVRHMLRSFTPQAANPLLWASTYEVRASAPTPQLDR